MPRIRTIKPEYWSDEKIGPLDPIHRLVFLGLISMADDNGRVLDSARQIDGFIFPHTSHTSSKSIAELERLGRIVRGQSANGQRVIQIANWKRHQRIEHPSKNGSLPPICDTGESHETLMRLSDAIRDGSVAVAVPESSISEREQTDALDEEWQVIKNAYPSRAGTQGWKQARERYIAHRRNGVSFEAVLAGVEAYRDQCVAAQRDGTEYVKQAATFFGPGQFWEESYPMPKDDAWRAASVIAAEASDVGRMSA